MDNTKIEQLPENALYLGQAGTTRFIVGEEIKGLEDTKDLVISNATMKGLRNFVTARSAAILDRKAEAYIEVESRKSEITLIVGEGGGRKLVGDANRTPKTTVRAVAHFSDDYKKVLAYMKATHPNAHELAMSFRKDAHLFEDEVKFADVFSKLRSTSLVIQKIRKDTTTDAEGREKQMSSKITEGKLDLNWNWLVPIYEGQEPVKIPCRAIYEVQDNMNDVFIILLNREMVQQQRSELKRLAFETISALEEKLGVDVIPIVFVDSKTAGDNTI